MNWNDIINKGENAKKDLLVKVYVNYGPLELEERIKKVLGKRNFNINHYWSPYSLNGLLEINLGKSRIFVEWYARKNETLLFMGEVDKYDISSFEEYISSGIIENSVLRLMRDQF
ncbi:MAG: hypothetical protein JHC29_02065 [Thermoplasmata archaeon]|nr:hypothetical protein [Thermoplasmata archaeon]